MKNMVLFSRVFIGLLLVAACYSFTHSAKKIQATINGGWILDAGSEQHVLIFSDGYLTHTAFNKDAKTYTSSRGGTYELQNNKVQVKWEYDTQQTEKVGQSDSFEFTLGGSDLVIVVQNRDITFSRVDDGTGELSGVWKISGRMQDGKINPMNSTGPRKTLKVLSGKRFVWVAINPESKEFFGTGGGDYTFANGKYTENIEFFSRDSSRVGKSLSFDDKIVNGDWHHTGLSSTGDKMYEVWSKVKK